MDRFTNGDYLVSGRYTGIYRISGVDGSILWRFGGKNSSFENLDGFSFSSQHDCRIYSENETTTIITLFDNASDDSDRRNATALASSGKVVALDTTTTPMTARVIKQFDRPDGQLTRKRGNVQMLPSGNTFICWSTQGYITEHAPDGRVVLEAEWVAPRFDTYRAYKFDYTGSPTEPPALKTYAYGSSAGQMASVYYVSWNGATEVAEWNFYGSRDVNGAPEEFEFEFMGRAGKQGFETQFMSTTYMHWTYAEAVSADGRVLGKSEVQMTILPKGLESLDGILSELTAPIPESATENTTPASAAMDTPVSTTGYGPLVILLIVVDVAFMAIGMIGLGHFIWNRRRWLSKGIYAPLGSSETELNDVAYHDQEAEK